MLDTDTRLAPNAMVKKQNGLTRLNLGCGRDIQKDWINLDLANLPGVDVVHDLSRLPLPFQDGQFDHILAKDILEHVDYIPLLKDLYRILKVGGDLLIQVPHFTSADNYVDPTHKNKFSIRTFDFFSSNSDFGREYYFDFCFKSVAWKHVGFSRSPLFYNRLVERFVNLSRRTQKYYELTFLCALFPAQNIRVRLVK